MMNVSQPLTNSRQKQEESLRVSPHSPVVVLLRSGRENSRRLGCGEIWARATVATHPARPDRPPVVTPSMSTVVASVENSMPSLCDSPRPSTEELWHRLLLESGIAASHRNGAEIKQWRAGSRLTSHQLPEDTTSSCPLSAAEPRAATCLGYARYPAR